MKRYLPTAQRHEMILFYPKVFLGLVKEGGINLNFILSKVFFDFDNVV
jgi:hypothetical protein